jgi:hypothetical protein
MLAPRNQRSVRARVSRRLVCTWRMDTSARMFFRMTTRNNWDASSARGKRTRQQFRRNFDATPRSCTEGASIGSPLRHIRRLRSARLKRSGPTCNVTCGRKGVSVASAWSCTSQNSSGVTIVVNSRRRNNLESFSKSCADGRKVEGMGLWPTGKPAHCGELFCGLSGCRANRTVSEISDSYLSSSVKALQTLNYTSEQFKCGGM